MTAIEHDDAVDVLVQLIKEKGAPISEDLLFRCYQVCKRRQFEVSRAKALKELEAEVENYLASAGANLAEESRE